MSKSYRVTNTIYIRKKMNRIKVNNDNIMLSSLHIATIDKSIYCIEYLARVNQRTKKLLSKLAKDLDLVLVPRH